MATDTKPQTLQQAILFFSDYENCRKAVIAIRWPDGTVKCPTCGSEKVTYLASARVWKCYEKHPRAKFSLKVGTLFEDSAVGLEKWLPALWLVVNCKNGISSYELARALGVTQKTAWFMLSRLRMALHIQPNDKFSGHVEADETYIGGKARYMHKARRNRLHPAGGHGSKTMGKVAVMGLLERHGEGSKVRVQVVPNAKRHHLRGVIDSNVERGSNIYSDNLRSYIGLDRDYIHGVIDHAEKYVDGAVHTNGLENFWSLLKRAIKGTYVSVEPFHLFRYLDEQSYRFNERKKNDGQRFFDALKGILGKRLTYNVLTGSELPQTS